MIDACAEFFHVSVHLRGRAAWDFREGRPTDETALGFWPSIGINIQF
jgi:hypothetical protein